MAAKSIDTMYGGFKFRSRVEARWAVFFDALGIEWEYEKEGYELPSGRYLPDFWLPQVSMWAEVKGGRFKEGEILKCIELMQATEKPCLMLNGQPDEVYYWCVSPNATCEDGIEVVDIDLSEFPRRGRFYWSSGYAYPVQTNNEANGRCAGVNASRAARFEHGQSPKRPTRKVKPIITEEF